MNEQLRARLMTLVEADPARAFAYWFLSQPYHRQRAFVVDWLNKRSDHDRQNVIRAAAPSTPEPGLRQALVETTRVLEQLGKQYDATHNEVRVTRDGWNDGVVPVIRFARAALADRAEEQG